jgi:hypothetical protein
VDLVIPERAVNSDSTRCFGDFSIGFLYFIKLPSFITNLTIATLWAFKIIINKPSISIWRGFIKIDKIFEYN